VSFIPLTSVFRTSSPAVQFYLIIFLHLCFMSFSVSFFLTCHSFYSSRFYSLVFLPLLLFIFIVSHNSFFLVFIIICACSNHIVFLEICFSFNGFGSLFPVSIFIGNFSPHIDIFVSSSFFLISPHSLLFSIPSDNFYAHMCLYPSV
jgi:hypothetical protein